jgi:hypothetical protein
MRRLRYSWRTTSTRTRTCTIELLFRQRFRRAPSPSFRTVSYTHVAEAVQDPLGQPELNNALKSIKHPQLALANFCDPAEASIHAVSPCPHSHSLLQIRKHRRPGHSFYSRFLNVGLRLSIRHSHLLEVALDILLRRSLHWRRMRVR